MGSITSPLYNATSLYALEYKVSDLYGDIFGPEPAYVHGSHAILLFLKIFSRSLSPAFSSVYRHSRYSH